MSTMTINTRSGSHASDSSDSESEREGDESQPVGTTGGGDTTPARDGSGKEPDVNAGVPSGSTSTQTEEETATETAEKAQQQETAAEAQQQETAAKAQHTIKREEKGGKTVLKPSWAAWRR